VVGVSGSSLDRVLVGQAFRGILRFKQSREFDIVEANKSQIVVRVLQQGQFDTKHFGVPTGARD
jgi:hypothetical protein